MALIIALFFAYVLYKLLSPKERQTVQQEQVLAINPPIYYPPPPPSPPVKEAVPSMLDKDKKYLFFILLLFILTLSYLDNQQFNIRSNDSAVQPIHYKYHLEKNAPSVALNV